MLLFCLKKYFANITFFNKNKYLLSYYRKLEKQRNGKPQVCLVIVPLPVFAGLNEIMCTLKPPALGVPRTHVTLSERYENTQYKQLTI